MKFEGKIEELNGEIFIRIPDEVTKKLDIKEEGEEVILTLSKKTKTPE